jgi:hypothetical protein
MTKRKPKKTESNSVARPSRPDGRKAEKNTAEEDEQAGEGLAPGAEGPGPGPSVTSPELTAVSPAALSPLTDPATPTVEPLDPTVIRRGGAASELAGETQLQRAVAPSASEATLIHRTGAAAEVTVPHGAPLPEEPGPGTPTVLSLPTFTVAEPTVADGAPAITAPELPALPRATSPMSAVTAPELPRLTPPGLKRVAEPPPRGLSVLGPALFPISEAPTPAGEAPPPSVLGPPMVAPELPVPAAAAPSVTAPELTAVPAQTAPDLAPVPEDSSALASTPQKAATDEHVLRAGPPPRWVGALRWSAVALGLFAVASGGALLLWSHELGLFSDERERAAPPKPDPTLAEEEARARQQEASHRAQLGEYSWVDRDKNIIRIPIERAMQKVAGNKR